MSNYYHYWICEIKMEGSYKSLQKQVDKLTQENLQLKEELQKIMIR